MSILVLVKKLDDLEYITEGDTYWLQKQYHNLSQKEFLELDTDLNTKIYDFQALKHCKCFHIENYNYRLFINHNLDENLLNHTELHVMHCITDIFFSNDKQTITLEYDVRIRLTFDGPDELALQWRLTI